MAIRIKPKVGDVILINTPYFNNNILIAQYFPAMVANVPFTVENITDLDGDELLGWGITKIKNVETGEVVDIETEPALSDYWCLLDADDSFRVIPG